MRTNVVLSLSVLVAVICCAPGLAQWRFADETEGYVLELPSSAWRAVARPDGIHPHTDFTYGTAKDVQLRIRLEMVDESASPEAIAARDEEWQLRFLPGFVDNQKERFIGKLNGVKLTCEYVKGGKAVAARTYYLRARSRVMYVLRFTGTRPALKQTRDQTDSIARSFHLK